MVASVRRVSVSLGSIADEVSHMDGASPLDPRDYASSMGPVVVEPTVAGPVIVDGYHRTAGLVAWAREHDVPLADVEVAVVSADGSSDDRVADLVAAAAEPSGKQEEALAALYSMVEA